MSVILCAVCIAVLSAATQVGSGEAFAQANGWTDDGTVVRLTTDSDNVGIGTSSPSGKLHIKTSDAGNSTMQIIENGDNSNPYSDAILQLVTGGLGGDPFLRFDINGVSAYSMGVDNSDGDSFKISRTTYLGDYDILMYLPGSKEWEMRGSHGTDEGQSPSLNLYNSKAGEVSLRFNRAVDDSGSGAFWDNPWIMQIPPSTSENKFWITRDMMGNFFGMDEEGKVSVGYSLPNTAPGIARLGVVGGRNEKQLIVRGNSTQTSSLTEWQNSAGAPLVTISGGGNVGIGTTAPASSLHVAGDGAVSLAPRSTDLAATPGVWKLYIYVNGSTRQLRVIGPNGTVNIISNLTN